MSEITFSSNRPTMPQLRAPSTMMRRAIGSNRLSISISCLLQGDNADSYETKYTRDLQGLHGQRVVSVGPLLRRPRCGWDWPCLSCWCLAAGGADFGDHPRAMPVAQGVVVPKS